jgi:cobalamin biosynthetic protein CobC
MLEHGGRLLTAARHYGIAPADWLDLSTGINPCGWPVPDLPPTLWARLPEADDDLASIAAHCYGAPLALPVAGSQAAIQMLPRLRPPGRVMLRQPAYAEHAAAWQRAGHQLITPSGNGLAALDAIDAIDGSNLLDSLDALVIINPNNPDGLRIPTARLLAWHARLAARGGWLVVDEAFIDTTPEYSLACHTDLPGLIVLRSLGKFFGLAGARVGFVLAQAHLLQALEEALGPWPIAAPARWLAAQALADTVWQQQTRARLPAQAERLAQLWSSHGLPPAGGCALFQWLPTPHAAEIERHFAQQGILLRRFTAPDSLRCGLPGDEAGWQRLGQALDAMRISSKI